MGQKSKLPNEYSACHVSYTKDASPNRSYSPPKQYVRGKVRELESLWGRMNCPGIDGQFTIDLYQRLSSTRFTEHLAYATLTKQQLGSIIPQEGDAFWLWTWKEERIGKGIIQRLHIEIESRVLTEEEKTKLRELAMELQVKDGTV